MKIHEFKARGVFGYLNLGAQFEKNPAIIIAPNGAGKTTMLRLMQALIAPSLRDLLLIDFQDAILRLDDNSAVERVISAKKSKSQLMLSISGVDEVLSIPLNLLDAIEAELPASRRTFESTRSLRLKYADDPVYAAIAEISLPVFLGLDRRNTGFQDEFVPDAEYAYHGEYNRLTGERRHYRGALAAGLAETRQLVQDAYRRVRKIKDAQAERLRKKLLLTGFEYVRFDVEKFDMRGTLSSDELREQREELFQALVAIGIDVADVKKEVDPFFEQIIALSDRLSKKGKKQEAGEAMFEAMLNSASVMRLRQLVVAVRESNQKSIGLAQKFEGFVRCINYFLVDSRKEIQVDSVGLLKVSRPGKVDIPIEALSSGERQLLIMFSHLFFNSFGDKSNVFIIDEPELSLHLKWQEALLEKMVESSPRAQIIVATHSPEIVGELTQNCIGVTQ